MLLSPPDLELFFRLHKTLMFFVNQRLRVLPDALTTPEDYAALSPETRFKVHTAFVNNADLINTFLTENPAHLERAELDIISSWRHMVSGKFYIFRELKQHTIFLPASEEPIAYGVVALSQSFTEMLGPRLPILAQTVLLPFQNQIVYDGLFSAFNISFGPGIRRSLNERFKEAKARLGIITTLPVSAQPIRAKKSAPPRPRKEAKPKDKTAEALDRIIDLINQLCQDRLNEEYAVLCRKLAEKLGRKRPSPLASGKPSTWASGIVRTIGWVNFLADSSQEPHLRMTDIDEYFGVSPATGAAKSKTIRDLLKIRVFDPTWTLPSHVEDNPLIWMLNVNGFLMDIRHAPREAQEAAFNKGLIPYIPADRQPKQE